LVFPRSFWDASNIPASDLTISHGCPMLLSSTVSPSKYDEIPHVKPHSHHHRFSGFTFLFFLLFTAFYVWRIVTFVFEVRRLMDMYQFYTHLLRIPDVRVPTFLIARGTQMYVVT